MTSKIWLSKVNDNPIQVGQNKVVWSLRYNDYRETAL